MTDVLLMTSRPLPTDQSLMYQDSSLSPSDRAADLLDRMTLEEKCAQLQSQIIIPPDTTPRDYAVGHARNPGHFASSPGHRASAAEVAQLINDDVRHSMAANRWGIPVLENCEALHGANCMDASVFPQVIGQAATWNPVLVGQVAQAAARETRAVGVRQVFAPVLDIARDPRWGRTQETFGEDPYLASRLAVAFVSAFEKHGVVSTPKHFVANVGDGGRDSFPVHISERLLREVYLEPYRAAIQEAGARSIMASYTALDGTPCSVNAWLLNTVLREEWGFTGFTVTDYGALDGAAWAHRIGPDKPAVVAEALTAGCDVELPWGGKDLLPLAQSGRLDLHALDQAVLRVLRVKFELGLFDEPFVNPADADAVVRSCGHLDLALEAARESMVLLKNKDAVLPLSPGIGRLGLFGVAKDMLLLGDYTGPFGGWGGSGPTPVEAFRSVGANLEIASHQGEDAKGLAASCDANVVFVTIVETEAGDRSRLELPSGKRDLGPQMGVQNAVVVGDFTQKMEVDLGDQEQLILDVAAGGKPTIVVLLAGSAVTMERWIDRVPAILCAWYPGERGSIAIAQTVLGLNNPGGKLPLTFPRHVGQVPLYYNARPSGRSDAYNDDDGKPQFCFGHGLSYTTFLYANLRVPEEAAMDQSVLVQCDITNTGPCAGDEVVQLYLNDPVASVSQPRHQLRGFQRVRLQPGETKTVQFTLGFRELALWNREMKQVVEPGEFHIWIGSSVADIRLRGTIRIGRQTARG